MGAVGHPESAGETLDIGGPESVTNGEMPRRAARQLGARDPMIVPVPVLTPMLSAYWVGLVTDIDWAVARPLSDGLRNAIVVHDDAIWDVLRIELAPTNEAVARTVEGHVVCAQTE